MCRVLREVLSTRKLAAARRTAAGAVRQEAQGCGLTDFFLTLLLGAPEPKMAGAAPHRSGDTLAKWGSTVGLIAFVVIMHSQATLSEVHYGDFGIVAPQRTPLGQFICPMLCLTHQREGWRPLRHFL